jgi:hypothetical protein
MWTGVLWFALLTAAGLCYPRRPRTAGILFMMVGALSLVPSRVDSSGSGLGAIVAAFWIALGAWQVVKYHNPAVRAKHVEYWTAKA